MKLEHNMVVLLVLLIAFLGAVFGMNTAVLDKEDIIQNLTAEIQQLETENYFDSLPEEPWFHPLQAGVVSSRTGYRVNPMGGTDERLHKGIDLVAPMGAPVRAVKSGIVVEHWLAPGWHGNRLYTGHPVYGCVVVLQHKDFYSIYGHLSESYVHEGDRVTAGEIIGAVGNTGISTGPHLHFEIVVDPFEWLEQ